MNFGLLRFTISLSFIRAEIVWHGGKFALRSVWLPNHTPIVAHSDNDPVQRTAQRPHTVAKFPVGSFGKRFDGHNHQLFVQHAGNKMGNGGSSFLAAMKRQVGKDRVGQGAANFREGIAIKKEERCPPVARLEELKSFQQRQLGRAVFFPFCCSRRVSF